MGDYVFDPDDPDISKLAVGKGVKRLAVCRADVDNLGKAFISGFEQDSDNEEERYRFVTLSRTATFSRLMSVFFRYYINLLLSQNRYRLNIVYSGGDDVFLIGNWSDVINVAVGLRNAFKNTAEARLIPLRSEAASERPLPMKRCRSPEKPTPQLAAQRTRSRSLWARSALNTAAGCISSRLLIRG